MADAVLTINAGSSSLKFSVYRVAGAGRPELAAKGQIEGIGTSPRFVAEDAAGQGLIDRRWPDDRTSGHAEFFRVLGGWLREYFSDIALLGVGHRVVHGGVDYAAAGTRRSGGSCQARGALSAGASAPAAQPRWHPRGRRVPARAAPGRLLRYRVPPRPPRGRRLVRPAAPVLRRRHPPLRLPRPVLRIHRARLARGRARDRRRPGGGRPSRQRRQHVRDAGRPQHRQHDGLHRPRRSAHGHPLRRARSRRHPASEPGLRHGCGRDRAPALPRLRAEGRLRDQQRHARSSGL